MNNRSFLVASLLVLASPLSTGVSSAQSHWKVGEPLPHVHLPTLDGEREVDLASFRGTKLLLIEFASW